MPASATDAAIAALWQRNRPVLLERLALLDHAASQPLTPALRGEAIATAHKLAGSLGMFGFPEGTRLARELELHLESPAPDGQTLMELTKQLRSVLSL